MPPDIPDTQRALVPNPGYDLCVPVRRPKHLHHRHRRVHEQTGTWAPLGLRWDGGQVSEKLSDPVILVWDKNRLKHCWTSTYTDFNAIQ
jgi:hypothetical protein